VSITAVNKTRLVESILSKVDCCVGMRDPEFEGSLLKNYRCNYMGRCIRKIAMNQLSLLYPIDYADYIVSNNGTLDNYKETALVNW
jgi:hypothetical protein